MGWGSNEHPVPPAFEEWHRKAHGEAPTTPPPPPASTVLVTPGGVSSSQQAQSGSSGGSSGGGQQLNQVVLPNDSDVRTVIVPPCVPTQGGSPSEISPLERSPDRGGGTTVSTKAMSACGTPSSRQASASAVSAAPI